MQNELSVFLLGYGGTPISVCRKLLTRTSRHDSDFERSNMSFNENKLDNIDLNSTVFTTTALERTEDKFCGFRQTHL